MEREFRSHGKEEEEEEEEEQKEERSRDHVIGTWPLQVRGSKKTGLGKKEEEKWV